MAIVHQVEYSLEVLGPTVTVTDLGRVEEAVKGTSSSYMLFACGLFGLALYRKVLNVETDVSGPKPKAIKVYRIVNAAVHFLWWLIMVWIVVLMMGVAVLAILTWVGHHATQQVLQNQQALAAANVTNRLGEAASGGQLQYSALVKAGWPYGAACPATCANLLLFQFIQVQEAQSCVCNSDALQAVSLATSKALDAVPGMLVGIWFMYLFGDFFKTALACDFTNASRDADGAALRTAPSIGRGAYNKL